MPLRDFSVSAYEYFLLIRNMTIYGLWVTVVILAVPRKYAFYEVNEVGLVLAQPGVSAVINTECLVSYEI